MEESFFRLYLAATIKNGSETFYVEMSQKAQYNNLTY